jgi:hypothetical protein
MRGRSADRVRLRVSGLITLLIALVAGLAVMVGGLSPANAATAPVSAKAPAAPAAQAAPATKAPSATKTARKGALSPGAERELRRQAARGAIAASAVPDTCAGTIQPDTIYPCTTPSSAGTDTFTLTLTSSTDMLIVRVLPADDIGGQSLPVTVTGPGNSPVTCQEANQMFDCATSEAGTYTLAVQNERSDYTIDYTPLLSDASCAAVNPSFAAPAIQGSTAAGATGTCYSLNMPSGHVLHANSTTTSNALTVAVYDDTGTQVCVDDDGDCTLTGPAPYRVFVSSSFGDAGKYTVQLNDITDPAGCVTAVQETYGKAPATSTDRCRTLKVTTTGSYQVSAGDFPGTLYTAAGTSACSIFPQGPDCQLAAGTYNLVFDDFPPLTSFPVDFIAADESRGCVAANDTDFATGPATGSFSGVGEEICLTLPTPAGKSDYLFDQPASATAPEPGVQVVDATGAQECASANGDFTYATCALSGQAPFRVILSAAAQADAYRFLVQRTDSTAGCAAWPRSGFGGSAGATVTLTPSSDAKCLTIPAAQHSTGEMIDYSNAANTTDGAVYVNDPTGKNVCTGASLSFCSYQAGVTYTALVVTTAAKGDTYDLVRRDVSKSATCGAPKSTTVGGPSTSLTLTSDLDTVCYRVTAPAADKLWFSARSMAPTAPGAQSAANAALEVTNAAGTLLCNGLVFLTCTVTGSTDYQVMVTADAYAGVAITTHLDTWVVGTASGWAPQCTAHQFSAADDWGPLSGTLTENAAGYCAVVNINALQDWNIAGTDTAEPPQSVTANIYTAGSWGNFANSGLCDEDNVGHFGFTCQTSPSQQPAQALLLLGLNNAQSPTGYTMQGVCTLTCAHSPQTATISSLSPTSGAAGPGHTVTVTGTGLNLGTVLTLASDANMSTTTGTTESVNAAGTSMTVRLDTTGVVPGTYDVVLDTPGLTVGVPSPGYDPGAYKVTAGPAAPSPSDFVPVNATRILDTATGTGAPKAEVAAQGTLTLTVAGKGGVPAKGVAAIALDVTAAGPAKSGSLVMYPDGAVRPNVTDLNFAAGQSATNLAVVPMSDGKVRIYNDSTGKLNLTADVIGYYTSSAGTRLTTVAPKRILDTRNGTGARKARVAARGTVTLTVAGADGVPAKGVSAVALDVTAIGPTKSGSLVVYPDGAARPGTTDLSFTAGKSMTELVVVPVRDGKVAIYNDSAGQLDLTADVEGYYAAAGGRFVALGPVRVLDTRSGLGGSGETVLPHAAAVTQLTDIPNTATSAVLQVTVTGAQQAGTLIAFADGGPLPTTQNVLFAVGQTVTDLVVVPVVNGNVDFYNNSPGDLQVVADLEGYYTP